MKLTICVIRHKPSGHYIPWPTRDGGTRHNTRGGSYVEPTADKPPRIFPSPQSARSFLSMWLLGIHKTVHEQCGEYGEDTSSYVGQTPVPSRIKEDMEIITREIEL